MARSTNRRSGEKGVDKLDLEILRKLGKNARQSFVGLARELKVSSATIHERVARLKQKGVLTGFHARVNPKKLGYSMTAFVGVITTQKKELFRLVEDLKKVKEVEEAHSITGKYDFLVKLRARDNDQLQRLLRDNIGSISGVIRHETMIALATIVEKNELQI